jgi:hypothetical protein
MLLSKKVPGKDFHLSFLDQWSNKEEFSQRKMGHSSNTAYFSEISNKYYFQMYAALNSGKYILCVFSIEENI